MRQTCKKIALAVISLTLAIGSWSAALAQDQASVKIILTMEKTSFGPTEPIKLQVRIYNTEDREVITRDGFFGQNFYTLITFTDPDGLPVRNVFMDQTDEPGPPIAVDGQPAAVVEFIPPMPNGDRTIVLNEAREFYRLDKYGWYTAQVLVPMETFSTYFTDERGVYYSNLDDPGRQNDVLHLHSRWYQVAPLKGALTLGKPRWGLVSITYSKSSSICCFSNASCWRI